MIVISDKELDLQDYYRILIEDENIDISDEVLKKVDDCFDFLSEFSKNKVIYGVNTGLGPMAQYRINQEDQLKLQYNLIRSHAAGQGEAIKPICVKAAMISRLKSLSLGYSGVHRDAIVLLKELINKNITPFIPVHGGVGASGDLVQLSHLALVLIGEGKVLYNGEWKPTAEVYENEDLKPLKVYLREGLGLINGTSVMSGIGMVNTIYANKLLNWSVVISAMINEMVESFDDHFSDELNSKKKHQGQQKVAMAMRSAITDSKLIKKRADSLFNGKIEEKIFKQKIQEYYSLRCVPQILGPISDTIDNAEKVLQNEINSVNDNPVTDVETKHVYHGGNFHGDYVSFEMDKLKIAITKLSMLAERQLNFLMNSKLNEILPPFVNLGTLGLNLGMQGTQFTATSTTAENQTLSNPVYVHSISNNNDNQDVVSMGTNSALMAKKVIDNTFEVMSIEFLTVLQAIDYLKVQDKMASLTSNIYQNLREIVPVFIEDSPKYEEIDAIKNYLRNNNPKIVK
ncbi:MAG: histidine ammonia-lyase [Marinilabiliales bacterium]|nr:MAG: histidine ammonia-lyase [Marinilabiliales bacterium]